MAGWLRSLLPISSRPSRRVAFRPGSMSKARTRSPACTVWARRSISRGRPVAARRSTSARGSTRGRMPLAKQLL